jgi:AAA+ ATPase superfamily predicted ATPase
MDKNPFIFGKPVRKEDFYNRKEEIEKAAGFIKNLQSFSIVGERRIGKTSFMEHVLSEDVLEDHGIELQKHVVSCFSLSSLYRISRESLVSAIIEKTREQELIEMDSTNDFEKLKAYVEELASQGRNLIIALDEFEVIAPILDDQFSHWLRYIIQNKNVMAITASQITVRKLKTSGGAASPLFNIFDNLLLGLFTRKEYIFLITFF